MYLFHTLRSKIYGIFQLGLVSLFMGVLVGCSATPQEGLFFYQLPQIASQTTESSILKNPKQHIWLEPIQLASQLSTRNIAFQTSTVNMTLAQNHLWVSPLDEQLAILLEQELNSQLPNDIITRTPSSQSDLRLQISVTEFNPRYDGFVVLSGRFNVLRNGQVILSVPMERRAPLKEGGYDEAVRVLSQLWQEQAEFIAQTL